MVRPVDPIRTERVLLRPFAVGDIDDVWAYQREPEVARYMRWQPRDRDEVAAAVHQMTGENGLSREGDCLSLAAVDPASHTVIGQVELVWVSEINGQGEIGYVFNPRTYGRGLATEAARELLRLGFDRFGLRRIVGRCLAKNTASAAVLTRLGMRQEARFVESLQLKGHWEDELVYAVLRHEMAPTDQAGPTPSAPG